MPDRRGSLLPLVTAVLLVVAGGLAIGGSFGKLDEEAERAGDATITLTYTSWQLTQGGTYTQPVYFHAPLFGIPLLVAGLLTIACGLLLVLGRGRLASFARPAALVSTGLLVGTVWVVGLVVAADLDAVAQGDNFELTWTSGPGLWLVLAGGVAAMVGGLLALFGRVTPVRSEPVTPRYGFPVVRPMGRLPDMRVPFIPPQARQIDPLSGQPITGPPTGPAALPVFQQPIPPPPSTDHTT